MVLLKFTEYVPLPFKHLFPAGLITLKVRIRARNDVENLDHTDIVRFFFFFLYMLV